MAGTYSLTLRQEKGSKLTIDEMDNNLLYLEQNGGGGGSLTGTPSEVLYFNTSGVATSDSLFTRGTNSTIIQLQGVGTSSHYFIQSTNILGYSVPGTSILSSIGNEFTGIAVTDVTGLYHDRELLTEMLYYGGLGLTVSIVTTSRQGINLYYKGVTTSQIKVSETIEINTSTFSMNGNDGFTGTVYSPINSITCVNGIVTDIQYGCLFGDSIIELLSGESKEIKFVIPGDILLSYDTESSCKSSVIVEDTQLYKSIVIDINNGLLLSSPSHNHYVKHNGEWVVTKTSEVVVGDILLDVNNKEVEIESMVTGDVLLDVYNIVVSGSHLYYANGILTHNKAMFI